MMIHGRATQRIQIQEIIDEYFERHIDISPRAMAALQGRWWKGVKSTLDP